MRDIASNISAAMAADSAQVTASGTGDIVDCKGFSSVAFLLAITAVAAADASNTLAFTVQEGDSALGYDFADVAANRITNAYTLDSTADAASVQKLGVSVGIKRYMRLKWTETGTVDATFSAVAVFGGPQDAPVA